MKPCTVIGAGPGGLTAAYELAAKGLPAVVYEKDNTVGGISRTAVYKGYRFDIGGHRFFSKVSMVEDMWDEILAEPMLVRPRLSRIYYDGKFFDYPLKPMNALRGLGLVEAVRVGISYLASRLFPEPEERNFEQWVTNRFGRRLFEIFFKTYTEKVWGMPCSEISADWAAQRIKNLDLVTAVKNALLGPGTSRGGEVVTTLIDEFRYPRHGPGMMWEHCQEKLAAKSVPTTLEAMVAEIRCQAGRVETVVVKHRDGRVDEVATDHVISSMPLRELIRSLRPQPPAEVLEAADRLRHRDFLTVILIVDRAEVFPDNWIYIHSSEVKVGRVQNFKNWSPAMVPDPAKTAIGLEYFVHESDELWNATDEELVNLAKREMAALHLVNEAEVEDGTVVRMKKAYPVYDADYQASVSKVRDYLAGIPNLQTIGRNGQHRYNNQDHSMLTGIFAARNVAGASINIWDVNVEKEYHEEVAHEPTVEDRLTPATVEEQTLEDLVRGAFAQYDPVALGVAVSFVSATGLALATAALLLRGEPYGPNLSLLGNYFLGYQVSWLGLVVGSAEASVAGFGFGYLIARAINLFVGAFETSIRRQLQLRDTIDPLEVR